MSSRTSPSVSLLLAAACGSGVDISGDWSGTCSLCEGPDTCADLPMRVTFTVDGDTVGGITTVTGSDTGDVIGCEGAVEGTLTGSDLDATLHCVETDGYDQAITIEAVVESDDRIAGTCRVGAAQGPLLLER